MIDYSRPLTFALLLCLQLPGLTAAADTKSPWGGASEMERIYSKQKVVFNTTTSSITEVESVLDRASYISKLNDADPFDSKIVIVLHGGAIQFFAAKNYARYKRLMERAQSLTVGGTLEFRMCKIAARSQGFLPKDIHGFVAMVPMGDAEIVQLQKEGFAYMR